MSQGLWPLTNFGVGSLQASLSSANIAVVPTANAVQNELIVVLAYVTGANATLASDAGDGWAIIDSGYDVANGFGGLLAACVAPRAGSAGYAGINLPNAGAYTAQCYTFSLGGVVGQAGPADRVWDLQRAVGSKNAGGYFSAAASSTAADVPACPFPPGDAFIELIGRGYNNGGTTSSVATLGSTNERMDTGQASPPHGIVLNETGGVLTGRSGQTTTTTSAIAAAATNRIGLRALIPISSNGNGGAARRRMASGRRYG